MLSIPDTAGPRGVDLDQEALERFGDEPGDLS